MTDEGLRALATLALERIESAFAGRRKPTVMSDSLQLSDLESEEVMSFADLRWPEVTFDQVDRNSDAVFWFAPEAFCYYLPGFLTASLSADRCDANAYDALIGMLDRTPEPEHWDDFFAPRWTRLSGAELEAVAAWVRWLAAVEPDAFHANTYERALETLRLLAER